MTEEKKIMKVYYKTILLGYGDRKGEVKRTSIINEPEYCCNGMREEYDGGSGISSSITYGDDYNSNPPCISIEAFGYGDPDYVKINFCPFCGATFEFIEKERYEEQKKCRTVTEQRCEYNVVKIGDDQ